MLASVSEIPQTLREITPVFLSLEGAGTVEEEQL